MAADIRFSENEKRNFASLLLSLLDRQNRILIDWASGASREELMEHIHSVTGEPTEYKTLMELNDLNADGDRV
jgi:hypothetical protein